MVAGEIGAGGIARNVPPVIGETGRAIVYGHGVFSIGMADFQAAFQALMDVENWCRNEYFRRFDKRFGLPSHVIPISNQRCSQGGEDCGGGGIHSVC